MQRADDRDALFCNTPASGACVVKQIEQPNHQDQAGHRIIAPIAGRHQFTQQHQRHGNDEAGGQAADQPGRPLWRQRRRQPPGQPDRRQPGQPSAGQRWAAGPGCDSGQRKAGDRCRDETEQHFVRMPERIQSAAGEGRHAEPGGSPGGNDQHREAGIGQKEGPERIAQQRTAALCHHARSVGQAACYPPLAVSASREAGYRAGHSLRLRACYGHE